MIPRPLLGRAAATVLAATLLGACGQPPAPPAPPKVVKVAQVGAGGTAMSERLYSGELRPRIETTLGFQVGGKIIERLANVGDHVKAGQVLARLDPSDTRQTVYQAQAQRSLAEADARRYRDLHERRFVSAAALDDRENRLKAAQAQEELARNQSRYTTLVAERSGVIGLVQADIGQVVTPGQPVFRMAPDGEREIALAVPESEFAWFRPGMQAEVKIYALPDQTFVGRIREISPVADPTTRMYPLRVKLEGVEKLPTGLTATVRFPELGTRQAKEGEIAVPLTAIYQKGDQPAVWVVKDNTVTLAPVHLARLASDAAWLSGGVSAGDTIVVAGVKSLVEGKAVRPVPANGTP